MTARTCVYCLQSVAQVTAQNLWEGLESEDWEMMAELYGVLDEDVIDTALSHFRIEQQDQDIILHFCSEEIHRIRISVEVGEVARGSMDETIEDLTESKGWAKSNPVIRQLEQSLEIVTIEMGLTGYLDLPMAQVFMFAVARWFAETGNGYMRTDDQQWWYLDGYFKPLVKTSRTKT
jgi:hypothetical protein